MVIWLLWVLLYFFFNDTATTEIYTLSLHDALPISTGTCATTVWLVPRSMPTMWAAPDAGAGAEDSEAAVSGISAVNTWHGARPGPGLPPGRATLHRPARRTPPSSVLRHPRARR